MNDIVTIMKAADFAARKHTNQKRKGEVAEPYLNHLIEVATLVAEARPFAVENVVAAAPLPESSRPSLARICREWHGLRKATLDPDGHQCVACGERMQILDEN